MLLKRMDEILAASQFDLPEENPEVKLVCYLPEIQHDGNDTCSFSWSEIDRNIVPRSLLFYNDTSDPSNKLITSWLNFYRGKTLFSEDAPYIGGSILYKDGRPCFGGIAKAAVYLRYSHGFHEWLQSFDPETAMKLKSEVPQFENVLDDKGKLKANWCKLKPEKGTWPLPLLTRLSSGKYLLLGLASGNDAADDEDLEELDIDVPHSRELMALFRHPEPAGKEMVSDLFQMGKGLGRNPFGQEDSNADAEYLRLKGIIPQASRDTLLRFWSNKAEYRMKFAPNPDTSTMLFLPEGDLPYSELQHAIAEENQRKERFFAQKKKKDQTIDDAEPEKIQRPALVPAHRKATVFLANIEGGQKKKLIIQQIFPGISVRYFSVLNQELLNSNLAYSITQYMKGALTGQDRDTPAVFAYWTDVFSCALQKRSFSARPVYANLQSFFRNHPAEQLIDKFEANAYFYLIGKLLRLSHLIACSEDGLDRLDAPVFKQELDEIEQYQRRPKKGVFEEMTGQLPTGEEILGECYGFLRPKEKSRFDHFVQQAFAGVPDEDFKLFAHGALIGMLLKNLCWSINQAGRRFSVTQGRHPTRLRGPEITQLFTKGIGLLLNLGEEARFNGKMMPFIRSVEQESLRDAFNSGMIMGMVYFESQNDKTENGEEN